MRDIDAFYATDIGAGVLKETGRALRFMLGADSKKIRGKNILLLGRGDVFGLMLLDLFKDAQRVIAITQEPDRPYGGWVGETGQRLCVGDYQDLPVPDSMFDLIIVVHALEHVGRPAKFLREIWRVASDDARIVLLTPSRRGFWARTDKTPFGHGHPYSQKQLVQKLEDAMFAPGICERALFAPPLAYGVGPSTAAAMEVAGAAFWPRFAGVLLTEARKVIYRAKPITEKKMALASMPSAPPV